MLVITLFTIYVKWIASGYAFLGFASLYPIVYNTLYFYLILKCLLTVQGWNFLAMIFEVDTNITGLYLPSVSVV